MKLSGFLNLRGHQRRDRGMVVVSIACSRMAASCHGATGSLMD
jgi:hypothetical protein